MNYPELEHYLGQPASGIVHSLVLERAMCKYFTTDPLSYDEKLILSKSFGGSATEEALTTSTTVEATSFAEPILKAKAPKICRVALIFQTNFFIDNNCNYCTHCSTKIQNNSILFYVSQ